MGDNKISHFCKRTSIFHLLARAIIDFEELIERSNKLIGPEHELTLNTRLFYCGALFNAERYEDCLA